jgi:hypothetical protein
MVRSSYLHRSQCMFVYMPFASTDCLYILVSASSSKMCSILIFQTSVQRRLQDLEKALQKIIIYL